MTLASATPGTTPSRPPSTLPITIVGGYLGTGKTSLVNHLLRNADGVRIAVLVNEFGSLSIDEDLIVAADEGVDGGPQAGAASNLISIAGGCVCCSYGNDLSLALMDMLELDPRPDHVLLESSGVAIPGAIAASVSLLAGYSMDGIVVLTNAETVQEQAQDTYIGDTIIRQIEHADLIVMNKIDLIDDDQLDGTKAWLEVLQPGVKVVAAEHGKLPPAVLLQSFVGRRDLEATKSLPAHDAGLYVTRSFNVEKPIDAQALATSLAGDFPSVLRAKGFVPTQGDNAQGIDIQTLQVVGRRSSLASAPQGVALNLVVIGIAATFDEQAIEALIADCVIVDAVT